MLGGSIGEAIGIVVIVAIGAGVIDSTGATVNIATGAVLGDTIATIVVGEFV